MPSIGVVVYVRWCKQRSYLANFNCSCGGPLWTLGICVCVCSPASGQLGINHSTVWAVLCRRLCGGSSVARLELENRFSIANCQFDDALSVFVFVGGRQAGSQGWSSRVTSSARWARGKGAATTVVITQQTAAALCTLKF